MDERLEEELDNWHQAYEHSDIVQKILITHLYVEHLVERYIKCKLSHPEALLQSRNFSFFHKLNLIESFGEIDNTLLAAMRNLNSLRNSCVHTFQYEVEEQRIQELGQRMGYSRSEIELQKKPYHGLESLLDELAGSVAATVCSIEDQLIKERDA